MNNVDISKEPGARSIWEDPVLRPFLGEVKRRYGVVETLALPNMRDLPPIRIEKLFVQPLLSHVSVDASSSQETWPVGETLLEALEKDRQVVLLGDPGSGKTTLANWLAWRLASGLTAPLAPVLQDKLPLPCVLREMPGIIFSGQISIPQLADIIVERLLGDRSGGEDVKAAVRARVKAGQYVLILDGIDEIPISAREKVAVWLQFAALDGASAVATARIVGYDDFPVDRVASVQVQFEPKKRKSAKKGLDANKLLALETETTWAKKRFLMPFDERRIRSFVENWYLQRSGSDQEAKTKTDDLLAALGKSEQMQELARTPNLLSLMAIVHRERANLPDGKALLYKEISNAYINTIDQHRRIVSGDTLARFSWEIKENWIAYVAFRMQLERAAAKGSASAEAGLLAGEQDVVAWLSEAMGASKVDDPGATALAFLQWVARRCGLLIPRGEREYAFVHLSFQEYFSARYIASRVMSRAFVKDLVGDDAPVTRRKLQNWLLRVEWAECFIFLFEIISAEHDIDWVEDLAEITFASAPENLVEGRSIAMLAARILADRHIHLHGPLRQKLASKCDTVAFDEWHLFASEREVLKPLLETEFALAIAAPLSVGGPYGDGIVFSGPEALTSAQRVDCLHIFLGKGEELSDISPLTGARNLQYVGLADTGVVDVSPLSGVEQLRVVEIVGSPVEYLGGFERLKNLRTLALKKTALREIPPFKNHDKLHVVDLDSTRVEDLTPIRGLKNLGYLSFNNTSVSDISVLAECKSLRILEMSDTRVSDLGPLSRIPWLVRLEMNNVPCVDISPISHLEHLSTLELGGTRASNLPLLTQLRNLRHLRIDVSDASPDLRFLRELPRLERLEVERATPRDMAALAQLKELRHLILQDTSIEDLSPLLHLKKLVYLFYNGIPIRDLRAYLERQN